MRPDLEKVKQLARDLRKEEPRSAEEELAGYALAARCLDKCRASLVGWEGDYVYGCPMDRQFLEAAGIEANQLKKFVATGASDGAVAEWITQHAHAPL